MTSSLTHTHMDYEGRSLYGMNANKVAVHLAFPPPSLFLHVSLFLFFMAPLGKAQEGLHHSIHPLLTTAAENLPSHLIFMCLYFNGPPGAASLWNASSDTFSDHFHYPATPERLQLNIFHKGPAQRKGRVLFSSLCHLMNISLPRRSDWGVWRKAATKLASVVPLPLSEVLRLF